MKPAQEAPPKPETPAKPEPHANLVPAEVPQPTSETIAEQAKIEVKSEAAAKPAPAVAAAEKPAAPAETTKPAEAAPEKPVAVRNITEPSLANVSVSLAKPGMLHKFSDPDAGDTLFVVTALPPTRGLIKRQDFVELTLLESIHGIAVRPNSDDVTAEIAADK